MTRQGDRWDPGAIPFLVGVCGHRDLAEDLCASVDESLSRALTTLGEQLGEAPLFLATGMAKGADRLAVSTARRMRLPLIAVLSKRRDRYGAADFESPRDREEFDRLLAEAEHVVEPTCEEDDFDFVATWLVRNTQLVIAAYDGVTRGGRAGTADVIGWKVGHAVHSIDKSGGSCTPPEELDAADLGPVLVIPAGEFGDRRPYLLQPGDPPDLQNESPPIDRARRTGDGLAALRELEFIQDFASFVHDSIRTDAVVDALPTGLGGSEASRLQAYFQHADAAARRAQKTRVLELYGLAGLFLSTSLLFLCEEWLSNRAEPPREAMTILAALAYGSCFLGLAVFLGMRGFSFLRQVPGFSRMLQRSRRAREGSGNHRKHLDYRALAESLRVALAWRICGIRRDPARDFISKQSHEVGWIRGALRSATCLAGLLPPDAQRSGSGDETIPSRLQRVRDYWVSAQRDYFARSRDALAQELSTFNGAFLSLLGLAIAVHLGALVRYVTLDQSLPSDSNVFVVGQAFLAMAGTVFVLRERLLLEEQLSLYSAHVRLFQYEMRLLGEGETLGPRKLERIEDLGRDALVENGLWLTLHSTRAPDLF